MSSVPPDSPTQSAVPAPQRSAAFILISGMAGAVVGAAGGYFVFRALASVGLYGIMIPGVLLGLAAGTVSRGRSQTLGVLCALAAAMVTVVAEWSIFPFVKDTSLGFFVAHVHELPAIKLVMMGLGVLAAYWFGQGR